MQAKNQKEFHKMVVERDGYICSVCFKDFAYPMFFDENGLNQYVCADHIKTKGSHPELKLETDNGRTICKPCHTLRHSKGLGNEFNL